MIIFARWKSHPQLLDAWGVLLRKMPSLWNSASHLSKTKVTN